MNIKQQLEHAEKYEYPVRVTFKGCVRKGSIVKTEQASFIMSVCSGAWHNFSAVVSVGPLEPGVEKPDGMRTVCKETLAFLKQQINWNKEDMGSFGEYIKTEYVYNLIDDLEKALTSNRVRMNWPFLEESAQDGANREMDEEDAKTEKPSILEQEWHIEGNAVKDSEGDYIVNVCGSKWYIAIAACPDAYRALRMLAGLGKVAMKTSDDEQYYRVCITESQCDQIMAVFKKAGIE